MSYEMDKKIFSGNKKERERTTVEKLNDYLNEVSCTDEQFNEMMDAYDNIINNQSDLDDLTEFLDNSERNSHYKYSVLKNFMNNLTSKYEDDNDIIDEIEFDEELDDEELEDEEIEEISNRKNKGIVARFKDYLSKKKNTENKSVEKKSNKVITSFKKLFSKNKNDAELEDEEIEEVTKRSKFSFKSLFTKKNKSKVENELKQENKSEIKFEDLSLQDKVFKYLEGTNSTWKDLANIVNKIAKISDNEDHVEQLNTFLNDNKDLVKDKKVANLVYKIVEILNNTEENKNSNKLNPKCEVIKKFFAENNLDTNEELVSLYNEIVMSDESIDKLYDFITNNEELAIVAENVIDEMNKILGKEVKKIMTEPKVVKAKKVPKTVVSAKPTVEISKVNVTKKDEENKEYKTEISFDKYKLIQDRLNDKLAELEYLKNEYKNIEESIYGDNFDKLTVEKKQQITLLAGKEQLEQLKDKLNEIKKVQQEVEKLTLRISSYYMKYGVDVKSAYEKNYSDDYNNAIIEKQKEEKMNGSLELYNNFNDEELLAVYKYMDYKKNL